MTPDQNKIGRFVDYSATLEGREKAEAQVFCDRLFQAFGHEGYKEAGAVLEDRVKVPGRRMRTKFADLVWKPRLLLEMKSRGEDLSRHYDQAFEYWSRTVPDRPQYMILCNFDEFWIYDLNVQLDDPVDRVPTAALNERYQALNFLFPENPEPLFNNNRIKVTRGAASKVAGVLRTLLESGVDRESSQRFVLQCVLAMFAEDADLLPRGLFTSLLTQCSKKASTFDVVGGLFRQMNSRSPAPSGTAYADVAYFNGGLFQKIEPIHLPASSVELLLESATENWNAVQPAIFGTLFQESMDEDERHQEGAHFTSEVDILKAVRPTITEPWRDRIADADALKKMKALLNSLQKFRVLDPACGSGNFLYVSYRELLKVELELVDKLVESFPAEAGRLTAEFGFVKTNQFYGIDKNGFAVELAKVVLMLAKRLAFREAMESRQSAGQGSLPLEFDAALPLDNLDDNIVEADAVLAEWPKVDAIVGNPPFQSKGKMQKEFGPDYLDRIREAMPEVPGRADYCVYWFRKAHDHLPKKGRAGMVGTNTIRENYSRHGGLDYITSDGGTINEAVASQVWSGDAAVHVSIVNWAKEPGTKTKLLHRQHGDALDSPWSLEEVPRINSDLTGGVDVTAVEDLLCCKESNFTKQGQTPGHAGFVLSSTERQELGQESHDVVFPYLIGDDLLDAVPPRPLRYVIDFRGHDASAAAVRSSAFAHVREHVLSDREKAAKEEEERNKSLIARRPSARTNRHHANFLAKWWRMSYDRGDLMSGLSNLSRYVACSRTTKRPVFAFVSSDISPGDALQVFLTEDDYSFGVLQSELHWAWFTARCSTLTARFRYTSNTVFNTFPWPQKPALSKMKAVAKAAREVRSVRGELQQRDGCSLRSMYRALELPGDHPLRTASEKLDAAVRRVYGVRKTTDPLLFLSRLAGEVRERELGLKRVTGPGLPAEYQTDPAFFSDDCITM